ncbi:MAG: radical SAM/SPASM domain-containing protein [Planctomycetota bacterium]|jgi:MoaA/NifB/PqqE/SkfB family radical SAM enzyme
MARIKRRNWLFNDLSLRKAFNFTIASAQYALRSKKMIAWPLFLKIDITPLCNLHCTVCVHANPDSHEDLKNQKFTADQKMPLEEYRRIISEVAGKTSAVSLYYVGDPYIHPNVDEMSRIAWDAGLNVHLSSNFSFNFSDERIEKIAQSGVSHLTVCVDGITQENYERTRIGGRIDWVLSNLSRLCDYKKKNSLKYPQIEVQYIRFEHNEHELGQAREMFNAMGIDQVTVIPGSSENYVNYAPGKYKTYGPKKIKLLPNCPWPYFSMVIKYNGDVIPCCKYRHASQYTDVDPSPVLGNVFKTIVRDVWNSQPYREIRQLIAKPGLFDTDPLLTETFCYQCREIFKTDS